MYHLTTQSAHTEKKSKKIRFFNIDWQSTYDGPGTRVVVYLQGCHQSCIWCHSPHSQPQTSPLLFFEELCSNCGKCIDACPNKAHFKKGKQHYINHEYCVTCLTCLEACPHSGPDNPGGPLVFPTKTKSASELFKLIKPQLQLLKQIGGITISGGEPLLQHYNLSGFLVKCQIEGFHTALETSGNLDQKYFENLIGLVNTWMIGLRPSFLNGHHISPRIVSNIDLLLEHKAEIIIRTPLIPGYTDDDEIMEAIADIMKKRNLRQIELLPYNTNTGHYYKAIGKSYQAEGILKNQAKDITRISGHFMNNGIETKIISR